MRSPTLSRIGCVVVSASSQAPPLPRGESACLTAHHAFHARAWLSAPSDPCSLAVGTLLAADLPKMLDMS